jgi:hypothetical protein
LIRAIDPADVLAVGDPTREEEAAEATAVNAVIGTALAATSTPADAVRVLVWSVATLCEEAAEPDLVFESVIALLREWRGDSEAIAALHAIAHAPAIEPPEGWQDRLLAAVFAGEAKS